MLNAMGAKISGIGSNILTIDGVESLGGCEYKIGPDFMEIGSFIGLAAATKGSITITDIEPRDLRPIKLAFAKLGIHWEIDGTNLLVPTGQEMRVNPDLGGMIPKIDDAPWPGFPPDLTSIMTVVATQVEGTVLIHEKMFESRMFFVDKLIAMGARITLCDPHRAVVSGPSTLHGSELISPDVRAGMAMIIAAMSARGESVIKNVYQVERGYENLTERLKSLGAHIERQSSC
jgi:UDP-N-acetylglucosamine 1-carboxyvinyltransferase